MNSTLESLFKHPIFPLLLGAFSVIGFAPTYVYLTTIASLIGLFCLWQTSHTAKQAALIGFMYGLGLFGVGIYWIYISLHDFGGMPWWMAGFATLVLCAFLSLFPATVGGLSKRVGLLFISIPTFWTLSEWVRSWIFTGFPWLTVGYSQVPHSPLVGYMPIIGVYGVSFITVLLASLAAYLLAKSSINLTCKRYAIATLILVFIAGGLLKLVQWTTPIKQPTTVALLQGNISQDVKWSPEVAEQTLKTYLDLAQHSTAKLIIMPETALPMLASQIPESYVQALKKQAINNQGGILIGAVEGDSNQPNQYFNSVLSIGSAPTQIYRKSHLVPFGEFIPLKNVFGWIYRDWLNIPLSDLSRGSLDQQPMDIAGQKVAVNICYEDVFGEEIIRQLPQATLLVNASNDAWYGESFAAYQHMQFSQARAIETGRVVLRATNTGATAMINPHGEVIAHAPHFIKTTLTVEAQGYTGTTPYVRWGNWPVIITLMLLSLSLLAQHIKFTLRKKILKIFDSRRLLNNACVVVVSNHNNDGWQQEECR